MKIMAACSLVSLSGACKITNLLSSSSRQREGIECERLPLPLLR